jgi:subtilisin family serine protease
MTKRAMRGRPSLLLLLGLLGTVYWAVGTRPAAAFGFHGFRSPGGVMRPGSNIAPGRRLPGQVPRGGRVGVRGGPGGGPVPGYGWPSRYGAPGALTGAGGGGGVTDGGSGGNRNTGGSGGNRNAGGGSNGGGVAARGAQRFVQGEVITAFVPGATAQAIARIARRYDLTLIESQSFALIGERLYRWRLGGRRSVVNVVRALGGERTVASVQPNFLYTLEEEKIATGIHGDAAQYVLSMLQIEQAQQIATGKEVPVAVIDSAIDLKHPDLGGVAVKSCDTLGGDKKKPNPHGTSIAGAIAAHGKLLGIAPGAELLAVRAFDDAAGAATGTSMAIYEGVQWAADNGARVINMSFSGPPNPTLQRLLTAAYSRGIVLIAAAGNGGPRAEPLYPAAYPDVIAVTAIDSKSQLFKMANRGRYIAVAAPGVDILSLAPDEAYQLATGTSIAAAHVSAIAALLLERDPSLKPDDIRSVLSSTAKLLEQPRTESDFGAGLVNAYRAVTWLDRKPAEHKDADAEAKQ